jgi:hypothetical protein
MRRVRVGSDNKIGPKQPNDTHTTITVNINEQCDEVTRTTARSGKSKRRNESVSGRE